ncbi:MAG: hypothetical protein JO288_03980 [Hyphomicrobiales bacterium]|nr:hypothetical protein [Hyphomicrobiales bacterium]
MARSSFPRCAPLRWRAGALAFLLALATVSSGALADFRIPARLPGLATSPRAPREGPLRIIRVTSVDPACGAECPEWISAEGSIPPGAAARFERTLADLKGRRLPVLISSHGGSVSDAMKIGALIRERHLAVAVARTLIANCAEHAAQCPDAKGRATTAGAICASACALILAGGAQRLVGPRPEVGVHQMTTIMREIEGAAHLPTIKKIYEDKSADTAVEAYFAALGIGDPVMALLRKTPASSIRWLSLEEIVASHLATLALDGGEPILARGANGLNGHGFEGDAAAGVFEAKGSAPLPGPSAAGATLEARFRYRPGGGAVEADLAAAGRVSAASAAPSGWRLAAAGADGVPLASAEAGAAQGLLPRERFCALMRADKIVARRAVAAAGPPPEPEAVFDTVAIHGARALVEEACP